MCASRNPSELAETTLDRYPVVELAGIRVHAATMGEAVHEAERAIDRQLRLTFGMLNVAKLVNAQSDALLRDSLLESDLVLADGMPILWLARLAGTRLPERVAGIDLMYNLLSLADRRCFGVFLLGASEAVNAAVAQGVATQYPGCRIAGRHNGYFLSEDEEAIVSAIRDSGAQILLVAMSPPKKELFLKRWSSDLHVPVCHGVGGSFDVFAGFVRRAPQWMQRVGLEWLYRVFQEPRRMWKRYLPTNARSLLLACRILSARLRGCAN